MLLSTSVLERADAASLAAIDEEKSVRRTTEMILLFCLGSITDFLILKRVTKLGIFGLCANPRTMTAHDVAAVKPIGIILSGGPYSVYDKNDPPPFDREILKLGIPVFGICLGFQIWADHVGAKVIRALAGGEYGGNRIFVKDCSTGLFRGAPSELVVFQNHGDEVKPLPAALYVTATSENGMVAAAEHGHLHGVQFHPEVSDTPFGQTLFENFVFGICKAKDRFPAENIIERKVRELREKIGDGRVVLAYSGGKDSSVTLELLGRAVNYEPGRVWPVYVKGLDLPDNERRAIERALRLPWAELTVVDATDRFLKALAGVIDMDERRRLIPEKVYDPVLNECVRKLKADWIVQGTLYTDLSESGEGLAVAAVGREGVRKAVLKRHHNVGNHFCCRQITPLDDCVKDGVYEIGRKLGLSEEVLYQHPCPGTGVAVRIEPEVNRKTHAASVAMHEIWIGALREAGLYERIWQAGANLRNSSQTAHRGDESGRGFYAELWAVTSENGFTARPYPMETAFLEKVSVKIANRVPLVVSCGYRTMPKPPATIEMG